MTTTYHQVCHWDHSGVGSIEIPCEVPPVECQPIDPPILAVRASVNDSPLAGKDGKYITLNALGERLDKEALTNPAIAPCS